MTTTFRVDTRAQLVVILNAFKTANPTMLGSVLTSRPENFTGDYPISFPDALPESIAHDSGTRTRLMTPSLSVVWEKTLNAEEQAKADQLVDALVDHFTTYPHMVTGTVWSQMTVEDYAEAIVSDLGTYYRPAVRFAFANHSIMEGRT